MISKASSYSRRAGDRGSTSGRSVLIGLRSAEEAWSLSELFAKRLVVPTLAFSWEQVEREALRHDYGLVITHEHLLIDVESRRFQEVARASRAAFMIMGHFEVEESDGVDVVYALPYEPIEVAKRGTALIDMRRAVRLPQSLRWGSMELDVERHEARWCGREISLTALQFRIMEVLMLAAGSVVSDEQLSRMVWSDESFDERGRLVAHIRRIRKLLEEDPSSPDFLLRVRGRGFRLAAPPRAGAEIASRRSLKPKL